MSEFNRGPSRAQRPGANVGDLGGGGRPSGGGHGDASPRSAVPWYVGADFQEAPPGHRYLLYLPFWKNDWSAIKEGKQKELKKVGVIPEHASRVMGELSERQRAIGEAIGAEVIPAFSTSPFATGLGWEHPNENGFAFLHPYGLPYLAGSGVKGVLRDAARELADGPDDDRRGWTKDAVTVLFGPAPEEIQKPEDASRGALRFFDVIPEIDGTGMDVDIMNPHYSEYYQGKSTPHDAGQPLPIFFLVVPTKSKFNFVVDCPREHQLPEELRTRWRNMIRTAFEHAFDWLGFGAKTAVGYGAMRPDLKAMNERLARQQKLEEEKVREQAMHAAVAGLPEDAAWVVQKQLGKTWTNNGIFLDDVVPYLAERETLSPEGYAKFTEEMENRWPGIMANPDAVEGRRQKPKFKDRPKKLTQRLLELKPE
ncbi:MAG: type III-B CRISPR module RAMP protein Cmr6 [Acidobacteria bacterium]|nr:type III-B CRISPR module RAMP protein Cmr6 [Acidobacteriota bacterium]